MTDKTTERLRACAIMRHGVMLERGFKTHWELRAAYGDEDPYKPLVGDLSGFITTLGRFVERYEAVDIAVEAGQAEPMGRPLLSSDINW